MFRSMFLFGVAAVLSSCTIFNASAQDVNEDVDSFEKRITKLFMDIVLADGISEEEKKIPNIETMVELTEAQRVAFAKEFFQEMERMSKSEPDSGISFQQDLLAIVGQVYGLANKDLRISDYEKRRLETYRSILIPNHTFEEAVGEAEKQMQKMRYKMMESEVPINLRALQRLEKSYEQEFDVYLSADPYPPKKSGGEQVWVKSESGNFKMLGFDPSDFGTVRGTYWVEVSNVDFTAYGIIDVDGDGVFQTYYATKSTDPTKK